MESLETERNASTACSDKRIPEDPGQCLDEKCIRLSGKFKVCECPMYPCRISGTTQLEDFIADLNLALPIQV